METNQTEKMLNKFGYKYVKTNSKITIILDYSLRVIIDFSNPEKIIITDQLVGWNFLTGILEMSLKRAFLYNFIGIIIATFLFLFLDLSSKGMNLYYFYLVAIFMVVFWSIFYIQKSENMKQNIIRWNEN